MHAEDSYVPIEKFAKDHWSTFAYAVSCMVDRGGFQVGFDARMRQGRRHFRVMREECPTPQQVKGLSNAGIAMEPRYCTILNDKSTVEGHDDWHCVQDLVNAGLLGVPRHDSLVVPNVEQMEPGAMLRLTDLGKLVNGQLQAWKADGGTWGTFVPVIEPVMA